MHNNRTSAFLVSGSFHWIGDFIGKHFLGRVQQDLLGCNTFGYGGPACQELWSLCPSAAEQVGPGALMLTWLFNLPGENSFPLLETIRCVWLLPKHARRTSGLLFQPLKAFFSRPEMLIYGFNNRIWTLLSLIAQSCLCLLTVAPVKPRL